MNQKIINSVKQLYYLLMNSLCFFICTFPLFFVLLTVKPVLATSWFYLVCSITIGPAYMAVYQMMLEKKARNYDFLFLDFFRYWKKYLKTGLIRMLLLELVIFIALVDQKFFSAYPSLAWLTPLLFIIVVLAISVFLNSVYLTIIQQVRVRLIVSSLTQTFINVLISFLNVFLFIGLLLLLLLKPIIGFMLFPSVVIWLIQVNQQRFFNHAHPK